jgi:Protein of unknown function (DUF982)
MEEMRFPPVCLKVEGARPRIVSSVEHAVFVLEHRWPNDHPTREKALQICRYALNGKAGATAARDALVYAAVNAGIYIDLTSV